MKKLFFLVTICLTIFTLFNVTFISVKALDINEQKLIEHAMQQTQELTKLDEFLGTSKQHKDFDSFYGGAFFENDEIIINIVDDKAEIASKLNHINNFKIKLVKYSLDDLNLAIVTLKEYMKELSISSISRSERLNTIIVKVTDDYIKNEKAIKEIVSLNNIVILNEQSEFKPLVKYVINGEELYFASSNPGTCTSGFAARNSNGDPGVVTAGHCVYFSNSTNGTDVRYDGYHVGDVGGTSTWKFSGSTDAAFIKLRDPLIGTKWLPTKTFMNGDTYIAASAPSSYLVQGTNVWMYGDKSGMETGEITSTYATVMISGVELTNTILTDIVGIEGDSGAALTFWMYAGSATAYHMVMGVLSGGNSTTTVYTTVDHIFSDLSLTNY